MPNKSSHIPNETGLVVGPSHHNGGIPITIRETGTPKEVEGMEYIICAQARHSEKIYNFINKTNKEQLDIIHTDFNCPPFTPEPSGADFLLCKLVVNDKKKYTRHGTVQQILNEMQVEKSCKIDETYSPPEKKLTKDQQDICNSCSNKKICYPKEKHVTQMKTTTEESPVPPSHLKANDLPWGTWLQHKTLGTKVKVWNVDPKLGKMQIEDIYGNKDHGWRSAHDWAIISEPKEDLQRIKAQQPTMEKGGPACGCTHEQMEKGGLVGQKKVAIVMHEFKQGKLHDGHGNIVTNPKQAIAIAMSEAGLSRKMMSGGGPMEPTHLTLEEFKKLPINWSDKRSYGKGGIYYNPSVTYGIDGNRNLNVSMGAHEFSTGDKKDKFAINEIYISLYNKYLDEQKPKTKEGFVITSEDKARFITATLDIDKGINQPHFTHNFNLAYVYSTEDEAFDAILSLEKFGLYEMVHIYPTSDFIKQDGGPMETTQESEPLPEIGSPEYYSLQMAKRVIRNGASWFGMTKDDAEYIISNYGLSPEELRLGGPLGKQYPLDELFAMNKTQMTNIYKSLYDIDARHQDYNTLVAALHSGKRIKYLEDQDFEAIEKANIKNLLPEVLNPVDIKIYIYKGGNSEIDEFIRPDTFINGFESGEYLFFPPNGIMENWYAFPKEYFQYHSQDTWLQEPTDLNRTEVEKGIIRNLPIKIVGKEKLIEGGGIDRFKDFDINERGNLEATINGKKHEIIYRDDATHLYDLFVSGKLIKSSAIIRDLTATVGGVGLIETKEGDTIILKRGRKVYAEISYNKNPDYKWVLYLNPKSASGTALSGFSSSDEAIQRANQMNDEFNKVASGITKYAEGGPLSPDDELVKAMDDLTSAEHAQVQMKAANKIIQSKKDVTARLMKELGLSEEGAKKLQTPDFAKRVGFPTYKLTNNNANIKRLKERVEMLKKKHEKRQTKHEEKYSFSGGYIHVNYEIDRVQIFFDKKPEKSIITDLKGRGWHWSPTNGAWQRKITPQAISGATHLFKAIKMTQQLSAGIDVEQEHAATIEKVAKGALTSSGAIKETAETHIGEDKHYYEKLAEIENTEFKKGDRVSYTSEKHKTTIYGTIIEVRPDGHYEIKFNTLIPGLFSKHIQVLYKTMISKINNPNEEIKSDYQKERERQLRSSEITNETEGISLYHMAKNIQSTTKAGKAYKGIDHKYANQYELNKAIEALLDETGDDLTNYSSDEKLFLRKYSGYGGLDKYGTTGKGGLFEYYTPSEVVKRMWALAYKYGYNNGNILEPAVGTGEFFRFAPTDADMTGYEINPYSAKICKVLYPTSKITEQPFEKTFIQNNFSVKNKTNHLLTYDLIIGNPPYGDFSVVQSRYMSGMGEKEFTQAHNYVEYFLRRGVDLLKPDGLLIFIIGAQLKNGGTMFLDSGMSPVKEYLGLHCELLEAYRLPDSVFERTSVTSDIIVLKKR